MAIIATLFYRLFLHPLSHLPGPLPARLTGLWRTTKYIQGNWHDDILSIHNKYGRVVRIAPNEVSVVDEYAMKNLYGHAPQLFSELDKKHHSFLRKRLASAYSMSSVLKYEVHIQACLDLLIRKLGKYAQAGEIVDMAVWTNAFAFDVVGELGYGSQFGHLQEEKDVGELRKTIFNVFKLLSSVGHLPRWLWLVTSRGAQMITGFFNADQPLVAFRNWSAMKVQKRLDNPEMTGREDLLAHFCRMKDLEGKPASFLEILVEAMNLV
ncbi:hypothetical protein HER10_EVM0004325 [Colletotrichum scovillei]|uniref:uncharacterized protein n=1 Tax=Colletotrichum scovillei TaxID=1209932 RepID=UPI0015C31D27|nr:uncharacterized protein HER10_EVM0004325 [Colletotrichum scovillei]KAF4784113.1 hypothetical protein HER10_EVM0004325 [Colletotrichum scovillei]